MDSPQTYLLKKIIGWETNGLSSLGQLHAKHCDDVAKMLGTYAEEAILEAVEKLNKYGEVYVNDNHISIKKPKRLSK